MASKRTRAWASGSFEFGDGERADKDNPDGGFLEVEQHEETTFVA